MLINPNGASPNIHFRDNTTGYDTIIGQDSAGLLSFNMESTANAFNINASGNVGIGTITPGSKLSVGPTTALNPIDGGGSAFTPTVRADALSGIAGLGISVGDGVNNTRAGLFVDNTNSVWGLGWTYSSGAFPFVIRSPSGELLRIQVGGNVGIGTTAPGTKLDIRTNGAAQTTFLNLGENATGYGIGNEQSIDFKWWSSTIANGRISGYTETTGGAGSGGLKFYTAANGASYNATPSLTLNAAGSVGIGTTGPTTPLDTQGIITTRSAVADTPSTPTESLRMSLTGYATTDRWRNSIFNSVSTTPVNSIMQFRVSNGDTTQATVMSLSGNGNVGIGTTGPINTLDVHNTTSAAPATSGSAANGLLRLNSSDTAVALDAGVSLTGAYSWLQSRAFSSYATNYNLVLNPNGGNVGIGTTTPTGKLHVVGGDAVFEYVSPFPGFAGRITTESTNSQLWPAFTRNLIGRASTTDYTIAGDTPDVYTAMVHQSTGINFFAASGAFTAGDVVTPASRFWIGTDGNVGIGTTAPYSGLTIYATSGGSPGGFQLRTSNSVASALGGFTIALSSDDVYINQRENKDMYFYTNNAFAAVIKSGGNVGIGTTAPNSNLELYQTSAAGAVPHLGAALRLSNGFADAGANTWNVNSDYAGTVDFYTADTSSSGPNVISYIRPLVQTVNGTGWDLAFGTSASNVAATEKFRITGAGNVGIGTTAPTDKLGVVAGALTSTQSALSATGTLSGTVARQIGANYAFTTTAGNTNENDGLYVQLLAGNVSNAYNISGIFNNAVAGTGVSIIGAQANYGSYGSATATTTGTNIGAFGQASGGNISIGSIGNSTVTKNSATNIGVLGFGLNARDFAYSNWWLFRTAKCHSYFRFYSTSC